MQLEATACRGRKAIDTRGDHRLHGRRHLNGRERAGKTITAGHTHQRSHLDECSDAFFEEKRVAARALRQQLLQRLKRDLISQKRLE